jgi:hypothetical protein
MHLLNTRLHAPLGAITAGVEDEHVWRELLQIADRHDILAVYCGTSRSEVAG